MRRIVLYVLVAGGLAAALTACGSGPSDPGAELSITLGSATVTVAPGASDTVEVTIADAGSGDVDLTVTGLPSDVTATFDPPILSGGATTSTLSLDVAPGADEGSHDLTVTATQGSDAASTDLTLNVTAFTVTGRIVTLFDQPFPTVSVAIGDQTATTDVNGEFTISGVSVPYDLVAYRTDGNASAHVFVGMTDATPDLLPYTVLSGGSLGLPTGDVQGTLPNVPPADHDAIVCLEGTTGTVFGCRTVTDPNDAFDIPAVWPAGAATGARIHALEAERDADGFAVAYLNYGTSASFTITNGGTVTDADVAAYGGGLLNSTTLAGSIATPPGFDLTSLVASSGVTPSFMMPALRANGTLATDFSIDLPILGEDAYGIAVAASPGDDNQSIGWTSSVTAGTSDILMNLPNPPTLTTPGDGATDVDTSTEFVINGATGAVKTFLFQPDDATAGPAIFVTTTAETVSIPDLSAVHADLALPAATLYSWGVIESPTVDAVDGGGSVRWLHDYYDGLLSAQLGGPPTTDDGAITTTASRQFTTD